MVVRMMKWRPWPPLSSKKFEAKITVHCLMGLNISKEGLANKPMDLQDFESLAVEIKWKGSRGNPLSSLRKSVRRNFTKEESLRKDGVIEWNEEFKNICNFSAYKEGLFHPWEVAFSLVNGSNQGSNNKVPVIAAASLNIVQFTTAAEERETEISIPLEIPGCSTENPPSLCLSLSLVELRAAQEPSQIIQRLAVSLPASPSPAETLSTNKNDFSNLTAGLRKVKFFKGLSARSHKKAYPEDEGSDGRSSVQSDDIEYNYPFDIDSLDDFDQGESEEAKEDSTLRKSVSYGTLAYVNHAGGSSYSNTSGSEDEDWVYFSHRKSDLELLHPEVPAVPFLDQSLQQNSKRRILPWRKRKLSFKSPKPKGEPLLKKHYGEEGGDDIDYDRRQLSSSDESSFAWHGRGENSVANQLSVSEFGDDSFAVGSWEQKEIISRDGQMKLTTQVFFASIDQRSERAAGGSACTALVAVIADWFQFNPDEMPIKSQFDCLIREGSLEWRNLCENETYRLRFPDKHFDLDTVLQAKVRPLSVAPEKSFIGFFHPEGLENEGFDFLRGAMSFDNIWDEISQSASDSHSDYGTLVYIISWNDHFFILKVEKDAYYIIDTLGERLYEGCNQAFILKFDRETIIQQLPKETQKSDDTPASIKEELHDTKNVAADEKIAVSPCMPGKAEESTILYRGKESCKEYIKSFLAAIPIRELEVDLKKGLMSSTPLHHRLQIEFHYTKSLRPTLDSSLTEAILNLPGISSLAA